MQHRKELENALKEIDLAIPKRPKSFEDRITMELRKNDFSENALTTVKVML